MPGAPVSSDATSIVHEMCVWRLRRIYKDGKSKHPTRTYTMIVNHRLGTTIPLFSLTTFSCTLSAVRYILQCNEFELLDRYGDGVVRVKCQGVWVVVDNGYHSWSATVPPFKNTNMRKKIRWSEWLGSMRKDVEYAFGITKGRFRTLKTRSRLHSTESVDMIWLTCCALHNMLREVDVDGLDEPWDSTKVHTKSLLTLVSDCRNPSRLLAD